MYKTPPYNVVFEGKDLIDVYDLRKDTKHPTQCPLHKIYNSIYNASRRWHYCIVDAKLYQFCQLSIVYD